MCWSTATKAIHCVLLVHLLNQMHSVCMNVKHSCPQNTWRGTHGLVNNLFCKSLGNVSMKKKSCWGWEVSPGAALPYASFCTMIVVTKCVSENHEALSSIFHQKSWGAADCTQAGLILPRPPSLGSFGAISLGREGMQQPFSGEAFHFAQVSVRPLELELPMGQGTAEPLAVPGADMSPGGSGSGRRRLAKMLLELYHGWR